MRNLVLVDNTLETGKQAADSERKHGRNGTSKQPSKIYNMFPFAYSKNPHQNAGCVFKCIKTCSFIWYVHFIIA